VVFLIDQEEEGFYSEIILLLGLFDGKVYVADWVILPVNKEAKIVLQSEGILCPTQ
jgi:hypothetical protein